MAIKLIELCGTNTGIGWWDRNRKRLNTVIQQCNDWQIIHRFDDFEKDVLLATVNLCREYGENHTFSEWQFDVLDEIEEIINDNKWGC